VTTPIQHSTASPLALVPRCDPINLLQRCLRIADGFG
jgi:hypothetical protein